MGDSKHANRFNKPAVVIYSNGWAWLWRSEPARTAILARF
jgi:hypothetical protein